MKKIFIALLLAVLALTVVPGKPLPIKAVPGWRNILIKPIDQPLNGYHRGDTVTIKVFTRQYPGGIDAPPLPNLMFWTSIIRPDGILYGGKWYWRTDANGERIVECVLQNNQPLGPYTFQAFTSEKLPDGTFDGDGWTFYVTE